MTIGVFDSGFGGLTVLKKIRETLPDYDILYLGDNARAPYGDRSDEAIYEFTRQGVEFLFSRDCFLVILACTTASAIALRRLQQELLEAKYPDRRILGIIIPVVEKIVELERSGSIGVIGTRATVASNAYGKEIQKRFSIDIPLIQQACPLLVPLIEEGWQNTTPARMILRTYLREFKKKRVSYLILGCTHYPLIKKSIQQMMGPRTRVLEPGGIVAKSLQTYLTRHVEIDTTLSKGGALTCLTTDSVERIKPYIERLW
ncbi:MAG: glutamate racemase [Patescibacteria group bacterium]